MSPRPRSASESGRIRAMTMRPAPEWVVVPGEGGDPVSRNVPGGAPSSTARLTTSHDSGTRCHSSMRIGRVPPVSRERSASMICRSRRSSSRYAVAARRRAVAVFPTPLAPSSASAGSPGRRTSISSSTIRRTYVPGPGRHTRTHVPGIRIRDVKSDRSRNRASPILSRLLCQLKIRDDCGEEPGSFAAGHGAVVGGQRQRQHAVYDRLAVKGHDPWRGAAGAEDRHLRRHDD